MNEFELIRQYFSDWPQDAAVRLGVGDDAAIWAPPAGHEVVVCTDTLVAGRHFPEYTAAHAIGWKSLAVNLSDLAAMGARPAAFLLALSLPEFDARWLADFAAGLKALATCHEVALIGGDTTRGPLTITITAIGYLPAGQGLRRSRAQVGDEIAVSGRLGGAALALQMAQAAPAALRRQLDYPEPQIALGEFLRERAHAAIDVSDGLLADLGHILAASGVAAELWADKLPLAEDAAAQDTAQRLQAALSGGDDYALCFTAPPAAMQVICAGAPTTVTRIGRILSLDQTSAPLQVLAADGRPMPLTQTGFKHF